MKPCSFHGNTNIGKSQLSGVGCRCCIADELSTSAGAPARVHVERGGRRAGALVHFTIFQFLDLDDGEETKWAIDVTSARLLGDDGSDIHHALGVHRGVHKAQGDCNHHHHHHRFG